MLRWLRRAFIGYSAHFLLGYGFVALAFKAVGEGRLGYTPYLAIIVAFQLLYEYVSTRVIAPRNLWLAAVISFGFAVLETIIIAQLTGGYLSPWFFALAAIAFVGAGLGVIISASVPFLLLVGFLLGMEGYFSDVTNVRLGAAIQLGSILATFCGWLFWRRYYTSSVAAADSNLSSLLSQEKSKSSLLIDSIEDGVVLIDKNGVIQVFNPTAIRMSGWKREDIKGLDYHSVLNLVDEKGKKYDDSQNPFNKVFDSGVTVRDNTATLVSKTGQQIAVTITASPLLDDKKRVNGVIGVIRDVTAERSQEKRSADFVSTASHEMRTPVAAIEGYLALALNDRVSTIDSKAREYLIKAHESTQHLGKLFQDLLTSTRAEDGRLSNHPSLVEMGAFIDKLVEDLRFSAEKKGLHMEFVLGAPDSTINATKGAEGTKVIRPEYYVYVDSERLREVVTNLFDNAVKYTESGTITIGLTGNQDVVQVSVKDTGPGIPADDIPHLFQKFYRVDNSATRTVGGTGLGLFICKKIIDLYNGRIWVESMLGKGSTFYINLPRLDQQKVHQLQNTSANQAVNGGATSVSPPKGA